MSVATAPAISLTGVNCCRLWRSTVAANRTLPVLPEYIVSKIQQLGPRLDAGNAVPNAQNATVHPGDEATRGPGRSGAELWAFLRPRLKLLVSLQEQWGSMHDGKIVILSRFVALSVSLIQKASLFQLHLRQVHQGGAQG